MSDSMGASLRWAAWSMPAAASGSATSCLWWVHFNPRVTGDGVQVELQVALQHKMRWRLITSQKEFHRFYLEMQIQRQSLHRWERSLLQIYHSGFDTAIHPSDLYLRRFFMWHHFL